MKATRAAGPDIPPPCAPTIKPRLAAIVLHRFARRALGSRRYLIRSNGATFLDASCACCSMNVRPASKIDAPARNGVRMALDSDPPSPYSGSSETSTATGAPEAAASGKDRRRYPRIPCRLPVVVTTEGVVPVQLPGTITDISPNGCFVEMLSPLPMGTKVEILFKETNPPFRCPGDVRNTQHGMGMGIAFIGLSDADRRRVVAMLEPGAAVPTVANAPSPALSAAAPPPPPPQEKPAPPTTAEAVEALVGILMKKGVVTRAELYEEIERIRAARTSRSHNT